MNVVWLLLKSARPRQWLKNVALFAAIVFTGDLLVPTKLLLVIQAAIIFTLLTGSLYIFNDVIDAPQDRLHPFKKRRPIASGRLPLPLALFVSWLGFFVALAASLALSPFFFFSALGYWGLHISYSLGLKKIPIIDVLAIASGFVIRVYAGALVINAHLNVWFLLTVVSAALFLAVGKRRSELTILTSVGTLASHHRSVLGHYTPALLDVYTGMFANTTWLTYALFSFLQPPVVPTQARLVGLLAILPATFSAQKLLMVTVPIVIYGVMRYLQLIYERNQGESPERVLLSDRPLLTAVTLWAVLVVVILYGV